MKKSKNKMTVGERKEILWTNYDFSSIHNHSLFNNQKEFDHG